MRIFPNLSRITLFIIVYYFAFMGPSLILGQIRMLSLWGPTNDNTGLSFSINGLVFYYVGPSSLLSVDNYLDVVDKFNLLLEALETCHLSPKVIYCSYQHVFFDSCPLVQSQQQGVINGCNRATF